MESDASHLDYGSALLSKETGQPPSPGQPPPVANDTRIVLGRLDQKLYASAEPDNAKAATRLGSDMGEFFMPYPGTRINQESTPLSGNGVSGSASYYEVKFSDTSKPNGQIWTGVVGPSASGNRQGAQQNQQNQRWFVVWLGTANNPVDKTAAKVLAESIRPWTPPPAPAARHPLLQLRQPGTRCSSGAGAHLPTRLRSPIRRPRGLRPAHPPRQPRFRPERTANSHLTFRLQLNRPRPRRHRSRYADAIHRLAVPALDWHCAGLASRTRRSGSWSCTSSG
ncbi:alanine and proline-rich secreted protein apa [Mycobacterium xenopi 3993]|nr:alanine and proline-rich secreted protein apa [Mycobacterium xenopi 3993]